MNLTMLQIMNIERKHHQENFKILKFRDLRF